MIWSLRMVLSLLMFVTSFWVEHVPLIPLFILYLYHSFTTRIPQKDVILGTCMLNPIAKQAVLYVSLAAAFDEQYYIGILCLLPCRVTMWELRRNAYRLVSRSGPAVCLYAKILADASPEFILALLCIASVSDYLFHSSIPVVIRRCRSACASST